MKIDKQEQLFAEANKRSIGELAQSLELNDLSRRWIDVASRHRYTYLFKALGRPIIQLPQDMVALSELIWTVKPDLVIETGVAHGGSLIHTASQLALLDYCEAAEASIPIMPGSTRRKVIGIDIDIREHNRSAIEAHPLAHLITLVEGSSIDPEVRRKVRSLITEQDKVMVLLDSNHTHEHVLAELEIYAPLVTVGSYVVVYDTVVEYMPPDSFPDRPWGLGDNPLTAARVFLENHAQFEVDSEVSDKLQITVAPSGYLKRRA